MNINEVVRVDLTGTGKNLLNRYVCAGKYIAPAEWNGEFQLWRLMQLFGPHLYNGMPAPLFKGNEIQLPTTSTQGA